MPQHRPQIPIKTKRWRPAMRFFHWAIALLILLAITLGFLANEWSSLGGGRKQQYLIFMLHKSIGLTVLALAIVRVVIKVRSQAPSPLPTHSPLEKKAAKHVHFGLYGLMFALPLTGWWLNSVAGVPLKYFLLFKVPSVAPPQPSLEPLAVLVHTWLAIALIVFVSLHIGGALKHHWLDKDETLTRMLPDGKKAQALVAGITLLLAAAAISGGYAAFQQFSSENSAPPPTAAFAQKQNGAGKNQAPSNGKETIKADTAKAPEEFIVLPNSQLGFTVMVLGQEISGTFKDFDARIAFNVNEPDIGSFEVSINTASAFTNNNTRDEMLPEPSWFSSQLFPTAKFKTLTIEPQGAGYIARSELTIRGVKNPLDFIFSWSETKGGLANLTAETVIDRMAFNIGADEFPDSESVGHQVTVLVELELRKSQQTASE